MFKKLTSVFLALAVFSVPAFAVTNRIKQPTTFEKAVTMNSTLTLNSGLTASNVNTSVKRQTIALPVAGGGVLTDGATYVVAIPMRRAGTIKGISLSAGTRMAGGTNTIAAAKKQGATTANLLSTTTVDPTAFPTAADTAEAFTLTGTAASLVFAAGDTIKFTVVCGTMTTDGAGYNIAVDVEYTDV